MPYFSSRWSVAVSGSGIQSSCLTHFLTAPPPPLQMPRRVHRFPRLKSNVLFSGSAWVIATLLFGIQDARN